jgi:mono/diheme cytochrome c family protein
MLKISLATLLATALMVVIFHSSPVSQAQTPKAGADTAAKVSAGQQIFEKNCMQCHSFIEGQYSFGPNLFGELKKPHPRKTDVEVRAILKDGKGKMPPFGDKLTAPDTQNLIAYLHTL